MTPIVKSRSSLRLRALALACLVATAAVAWTEVPVSAEFGGCCGLAVLCAIRQPNQLCIVDPECQSGEWCCWGDSTWCSALPEG